MNGRPQLRDCGRQRIPIKIRVEVRESVEAVVEDSLDSNGRNNLSRSQQRGIGRFTSQASRDEQNKAYTVTQSPYWVCSAVPAK